MPKICMHFIISGHVQGVFYRSETQKKANTLNLTGYVKNVQNGNVEVFACGAEKNIKQFEKWLWHGPKFAQVTSVTFAECDWQDYDNFVIEY